ncbi:MAG: DNA methyltransferase, partial [Gaiellaceae bacterium]
MARRTRRNQKQVDDYRHEEAKRLNNPPATLAREDLDQVPTRKLSYDPHLPPELWWAGKDHSAQLEVEAPSIHIHERLAAEAIVRAAQKEDAQLDLFGDPGLDHSKAIEFYEHEMDWVNRLILGDSLVVMTSLLERERLGGQVQMIYIDPPYGINFNSNFQARISETTPREATDDALTREPEQIRAYRDTWELGVHSYLTYLRDRFVAARELLAESGSIFVQIGPDNVHFVRCLLDEVFGRDNACPVITCQKTSQARSKLVSEVCDFLLWYAKDRARLKYRPLMVTRGSLAEHPDFDRVLETDGSSRKLTSEERLGPDLLPDGARVYKRDNPTSQGFSRTKTVPLTLGEATFECLPNRHWMLRV